MKGALERIRELVALHQMREENDPGGKCLRHPDGWSMRIGDGESDEDVRQRLVAFLVAHGHTV